MHAGRLSTRISIEADVDALDAYGATIRTWQTLAQVWADVRHTSGKEAITGDAITSLARASMRIRWRTGLTAGMRVLVLDTGRYYDVRSVLPDLNKREYIDLVCEATS